MSEKSPMLRSAKYGVFLEVLWSPSGRSSSAGSTAETDADIHSNWPIWQQVGEQQIAASRRGARCALLLENLATGKCQGKTVPSGENLLGSLHPCPLAGPIEE